MIYTSILMKQKTAIGFSKVIVQLGIIRTETNSFLGALLEDSFRDVFQVMPCFSCRNVFRARMLFPRGFGNTVSQRKTMEPHRVRNVL